MLDAQAGVRFDGETPPEPEGEHLVALRAFNLLANGMGGIDWAGFGLVCARLGVADPEHLMDQLLVIKTHTPPTEQ